MLGVRSSRGAVCTTEPSSCTERKSFERHLFDNYELGCQAGSWTGEIIKAEVEKGNSVASSILVQS